jgi:hypothetical protein
MSAAFAFSRSLPVLGETDVLVVGSGAAGSTAAIAAARGGAKTWLLERYGFLGGTSTLVLDTFYGFFTPGTSSKKVVGGIPDDVLTGLRRFGAYLERPNTYGAGTGVTYHPDYLKVVWEELTKAAGVKVTLHAWLQDVIVESDRVVAAVVATKMGLGLVRARVVIDASGDADVCHYAGVPYEKAGELEPAQTLTTTFRMCNVDAERRKAVSRDAFQQLMGEAAESGAYELPRREGSDHVTTVPGMTATIMTRLRSFDGTKDRTRNATDPELLTNAEIEGRRQAIEYVRFLRDKVPGYERASLVGFGTQIGIRETRRVHGDYRLTREEVLEAKQFEDQIGLCGAPIEDHREGTSTHWKYLPDGKCVGIPFRTLLPQKIANVLVAGRCFSATHDAHASVRSMAQCMAMGQAAGTAAALALSHGDTPRQVPLAALLDELRTGGAVLEA